MGSVFLWSFCAGFLAYLSERSNHEVVLAKEELALLTAAVGEDDDE